MRRDTSRARFALALLVLTSVTLISVDRRDGSGALTSGARELAGAAVAPVHTAVGAGLERLTRLGGSAAPDEIEDEVEALRQQNARLRRELLAQPDVAARADRLAELLGLAAKGGYRTVPAQVLTLGPPQALARTATLDVGRRDGVGADMTVVDDAGLVGRVTRVTATTATVLLATDPTFSVGVRTEGGSDAGVATGGGVQAMALTMLDPRSPLATGDRVVTRGSLDGVPFVAGVPVGTVSSARSDPGSLSRSGTLTPYARFGALDLVGVVVEPPRSDPRDAVLPPAPAA